MKQSSPRLPSPSSHRPRKRFGQHFLAPAWADKLVAAIAPRSDERFLEIGPGHGILTRPLAARAAHVVVVEIDRDLAASLRAVAPPNVTVIEADFLTLSDADLADAVGPGPVRLAANLPYNVASPILFRLTELAAPLRLEEATVMLQQEVADRLLASPGSRDYGVLTILVGRHASVGRVFTLPPGAFRPPPKVRSSVVRLTFHPPTPPSADERFVERVVQAAFTRRRKILSNALLALAPEPLAIAKALEDNGLAGTERPETVTVAQWTALADALGRRLPGGC